MTTSRRSACILAVAAEAGVARIGGDRVLGVTIAFEVERAGCESCAALVREALEPLGTVESIEVDEASDRASVRLAGAPDEQAVNTALAVVSPEGHAYRVQPGSLVVAPIQSSAAPS